MMEGYVCTALFRSDTHASNIHSEKYTTINTTIDNGQPSGAIMNFDVHEKIFIDADLRL